MILDVRTEEEYRSGHVHYAVNIPLSSLDEGTVPDCSTDDQVFVYCRSGARAQAAVDIIRARGFTNVVHVGGLEEAMKLKGNAS